MTSTAYACLTCGANDADADCRCGQPCIECEQPATVGDLCAQCDYFLGDDLHEKLTGDFPFDLRAVMQQIHKGSYDEAMSTLKGLVYAFNRVIEEAPRG